MERLAALWGRMPRWAHGLALGNLGFFAVVTIAQIVPSLSGYIGSEQLWPLALVLALIWPLVGPNAFFVLGYYGIWCILGALFVQRLGEVKGMILAFCLIYAIGIALSLYMLTHISWTIL